LVDGSTDSDVLTELAEFGGIPELVVGMRLELQGGSSDVSGNC
jgi:hypothetical protein